MLRHAWSICVAAAVFSLALPAFAVDLAPADRSIEVVIDEYVSALAKEEKVELAPQIDDANLIRRLTLDIAGRIPTTQEAKEFVASTSATKRIELVDRLLASRDFQLHQRNELDYLLQPTRSNDDLRKYLTWAVEQNRAWHLMFQDMLIGDEENDQQKLAMHFLRSRAKNLDDMTNDTSVLFFGVNVSCAKCHDHPLVEDWKQDHYYGLTSFFSRIYSGKKDRLGEKFWGEVKFKTTKGVEKQAQFMFLTGAVVTEPKVERTDAERKEIEASIQKQMKEDNPPAPPKPEFSPRAKLVEIALRDGDNSYFSKNIANRVWARLLGRGIVDPPDQLHSQNAPSHPQLLDWLARDVVSHGYDLKRLVRGIVLSQTYSRSSHWSSTGELPDPKLFAVGVPRALTPRQYALSLLIASSNPTSFPALDKVEEWSKRRDGLEGAANGLANTFELPKEGFQVAVDEALFFSNNSRIEGDLLRDSNDKLIGHLKPMTDQQQQLEAASWAISTRSLTAEERASLTEFLAQRSSRPMDGLKHAVWALMSGPELRFNY